MVTFVLATYALVTFVHISNISAVTGPILTKLFGPNFFGVIIFVDQNVLGQNFFKTQNFIRAQSFQTRNFIGPKENFELKFLLYPKLDEKFFGPTIFFEKIFPTKNLFWSEISLFQIFFQIRNFFGPKLFRSKILLVQKKFLTKIFSDQSFFRQNLFFSDQNFPEPK